MKTSNLITDFLIIGIICVITITMPYFIIDTEQLTALFEKKIGNTTLLITTITLFTYILGILFYQFSDYGIKFLSKIFKIKEIQNTKENIQTTLGISYHKALQRIVVKSKNSFDYLSYRRTIIRIIRALFFSSFLFIFLHIVYSIVLKIKGVDLEFSKTNLLILIGVLLLNLFCRFIYIKQYKGYFNAITIFNQLILEDGDEISD